jgi:hypothetical protein
VQQLSKDFTQHHLKRLRMECPSQFGKKLEAAILGDLWDVQAPVDKNDYTSPAIGTGL